MSPGTGVRSSGQRPWAVAAALLVVAALVLLARSCPGPLQIASPRPAEVPGSPSLDPLPASEAALPVRVRLGALVDEVEEAVPAEWGSLDDRHPVPGSEGYAVAFDLRRAPFEADFDGSTARLTTVISYRARAWYDPPVLPEIGASCGIDEPRRRLRVSLEGPLALTPDWRLSARTREVHVTPLTEAERDRCEVTFAGIDVTDRVVEEARSFLMERRSAIDSIAAAADIRSSFEAWWDRLRTPIRLADDAWLSLRPVRIRRGPIHGEGAEVEVSLSLVARPVVVLGERPPATGRPLPGLDSTAVVAPGIDLRVDGRAEYGALGRRLTRRLEGTTVRAGWRRMTIRSLELSGIGGGRVALGVEVDGDVEGRLYLVGTPAFDGDAGTVSIPDLEFSVETSDRLVAGASWIADAGIESLLRRRARWRVSRAAAWAGRTIEDGLNTELTEGVRLRGEVEEVRILAVSATRSHLRVRARVTARSALLVDEEA